MFNAPGVGGLVEVYFDIATIREVIAPGYWLVIGIWPFFAVRDHFMKAQLRLAAAAAAVLGAAWGGAAFADWPFGDVVRLEPGYGGVCEGCDLSGRLLVGVKLTNGVFRRANFSHAVLTRVNASGAVFEDANFAQADLSHAKLMDTKCARARFESANLSHSDAARGDFIHADFRNADLEESSFVGANLSRASFHGARLGRVDFSGADLSHAMGLTQAQIGRACGDATTMLPPRLHIPRCM